MKILILLGFKEGYLFLRNMYGLIVHPGRTIVKIYQKPDWSQVILTLGFPGYLWTGGVFIFTLGFFLLKDPEIRDILFFLFITFNFLVLLFCGYLIFWLIRYFWICRLKPKR